jgi:uncharacterized membrane protein
MQIDTGDTTMQMNVENAEAAAGQHHAARLTATRARHELVLGAAGVATGLLAGFFYAYACSVMPGLHASSDRTAVEAMQNINEAVENPVFFASFMGAPALAIWALVTERRHGSPVAARWVAAGVGLCAIGLLVTFAFNIPLNNELEKAGDPGTIADIARVRADFDTPWTIWNVVRTVAVSASFGCLARALFIRGRRG